MENKQVRVRFAPSPTGPLHIGGLRTALFNYLFAKHNKGAFILRIEDTDQARYVPGAEQYIVDALHWCRLSFDEGPTVGGGYGPYRQSERKAIYQQYAQQLVDAGYAYYAFDTPEELEAMRKKLQESKQDNQQYNAETRSLMKNSLTLNPVEVENLIVSGFPYVIRLKLPANEVIHLEDKVYGDIEFLSSQLDDKILFKSDGMPTYHLANVVDDHLMQISHVIRGSEWINSTPIHLLLYKYLGWGGSLPVFAHMPLILKPNGKGKLSKRDGDQGGFPVFPLQWANPDTGEVSSGFRESGYFPDAFINMLALLGWNPGSEQEIFSLDELIHAFTIIRIGKSGARFDPEKALWFNHQYLIHYSDKQIAGFFKPVLQSKNVSASDSYIIQVVSLVKERVNFIHEIWNQSFYFFQAPRSYDEKMVKKRWKENTPAILRDISVLLEDLPVFSENEIENSVKSYIESHAVGFGQVLNALRLALVGSGMGPSLFKIIEMIGKDESRNRIGTAIETLTK